MMIDLELFDDITPKCVSFCGREWEGRGEGERGGTESWSLFRFGIVGQQKTLGNYVQASTGMFLFFQNHINGWNEEAVLADCLRFRINSVPQGYKKATFHR